MSRIAEFLKRVKTDFMSLARYGKDAKSTFQGLCHFLNGIEHHLTTTELKYLCSDLEGWSRSDIHNLVKRVAMAPLREFNSSLISAQVPTDQPFNPKTLRAVTLQDFMNDPFCFQTLENDDLAENAAGMEMELKSNTVSPDHEPFTVDNAAVIAQTHPGPQVT